MKITGDQETSEVISIRSYMGTLLLGSIPILGDLLLMRWSTDKTVRESKQNLCSAYYLVRTILIYPMLVIIWILGYYMGVTR